MKKHISILLLGAMIFFMLAFPLSALAETMDTEEFEDALQFSCSYDSIAKKISVAGTMQYHAFAEHKDSKLVVYAVAPNADEYEVAKNPDIEPLANADASIRFEFSFKVSNLADIYSRYAIFLRSPKGELTLGTEAQYPEVTAVADDIGRNESFKGIYSGENSEYASLDVGTAILPVYLDGLYTEGSGGYIYSLEGKQLFFDKDYIDELDKKVNSLSISGARVYLQFLYRKDGVLGFEGDTDDTEYLLPDVYDYEVLKRVHAASQFLATRYSKDSGAEISGLIVGKSWDEYAKYNGSQSHLTDITEYAHKCAFYTILVANSARSINRSLEVLLPFGGNNFKSDADYNGTENRSYSTKQLIECVMAYFDASLESGLDCSILLEASETPFGITNENIENGISYDYEGYSSEIYAGNEKIFSAFLKELDEKYSGVPKSFAYMWSPDDKLSGNALAAAYTYSYYALLSNGSISFFATDFGNRQNLGDASRIVKYINTDKGYSSTKYLLEYFGKTSWQDVVQSTLPEGYASKLIFNSTAMQKLPDGCRGSFKYFDFSHSLNSDGWYMGVGCADLKIDYADSEIRALKAEINAIGSAKGEIIYDYELYENTAYTPFLKFDFRISDDAEDSLYEVTFICENQEARLEASCIVSGNAESEAVINLTENDYFRRLENLKIAVRCIYGDMEGYTLWLEEISGHSRVYDSAKLADLIQKERDKIRDIQDSEEQGASVKEIAIVICVAAVIGAVGICLFIVLKRDNRTARSDE